MGNVIPCFVLKWENLFPIEIGPNNIAEGTIKI